MKSIMISHSPESCKLILSGEKTLDIRKAKPKIDPPFKCYIYCTLSGSNEFFKNVCGGDVAKWNRSGIALKKGKVVGEYVCDKIVDTRDIGGEEFFSKSKMTLDDWRKYTNYTKRQIWGYYITDVKIYEPMLISNFYKRCKLAPCGECIYNFLDEDNGYYCGRNENPVITRPPQTWIYVEGPFINQFK